ncbi:hypothetical protein APE01nite_14670 [Acetobacter peroxydans]|uniref:Uncharacterized protein n=1 Tax=Acetobacter peroxydans TaxID=104098 RepID=A0A4Y3TXF9_9PROT|nr:hypothetical protein AA0475_0716 [Acetobacter peroxydans]GEB85670.1 hypothetical protein APE01nite_14670 [Acetobacter peroxydans]
MRVQGMLRTKRLLLPEPHQCKEKRLLTNGNNSPDTKLYRGSFNRACCFRFAFYLSGKTST